MSPERKHREDLLKTRATESSASALIHAGQKTRQATDNVSSRREAAERRGTISPSQRASVSDWSELMARAQEGDNGAYRCLLNEITPYLRSFATARLRGSADAEDAVQDILLAVHRLRHTYDPGRPFGPWLVTIAKRKIIDGYRRETRHSTRAAELKLGYETFLMDQANSHERELVRHGLRKAADELPASQREAIRLLKLEGMSLKEASAVSGISISALKVASHRAMKNLKKIFRDEYD